MTWRVHQKKRALVGLLFGLMVLGGLALAMGCSTSLNVSRFDPQPWQKKDKHIVADGIYYALPAAEYEVAVVRKLLECKKVKERWKIKIDVSAEITAKYKPDLHASYFLDYRWLDRAMKQTDLRIDLYENGTLKSMNAGFTDFTADVLEKTVGTALNLVASAAGLPALPVDLSASQKKAGAPVKCQMWDDPRRAKVFEAMNNINALRVKTRVLKNSIPALEHALKVTASHRKVDLTALIKAQGELEKRQRELLQQEALLEKYNALLTHKTAFSLTPRLVIKKAPSPTPEEVAAGEWFDKNSLKKFGGGQAALKKWFVENKLQAACLKEKADNLVGLTLMFYGVKTKGKFDSQHKVCCFGSPSKEPEPGLVYRQPLLTKWALCRGKKGAPCGSELKANVVRSGEDLVPQLGVLLALPLESDVFEDQTLEAKFRPDGSLEFAKFVDKASAVKASQAFATSAGALAQYLQARGQEDKTKAQDEADRLKAEKDKIEAELALEKAKKALEEYRATQGGN